MTAELYALPLLMLNLGGELIYIIRQRLGAHNIPADKAKPSMNISNMIHIPKTYWI